MKLIIRKYNQEFFAVNASPTIVRLIVRVAEGGSSNSGVQSVTAGTNVTITGTATNPIINAPGGGSSYLSYVALLNQSGGADAPVPTEQNNTIDPDAVWEYGSSGYYFMNTNVDYVANKIWGISDYDSSTPKQLFPLLAGTSLVGYYQIGFYNNAGKISFQLDTRNPSFVQEDIVGGFNISLPEIRVYQ